MALAINENKILIMGGHGDQSSVAIFNAEDETVSEHKAELQMAGFSYHYFRFSSHGNQCRLGDDEAVYALINTDIPSYHMISYKLGADFVTKIEDF